MIHSGKFENAQKCRFVMVKVPLSGYQSGIFHTEKCRLLNKKAALSYYKSAAFGKNHLRRNSPK
jgi:hypothetical protein